MEHPHPRNSASSAASNGNGVADFEVVPPGCAVPMSRARVGIVINRDHIVGFAACALLFGLAYWVAQKCKD